MHPVLIVEDDLTTAELEKRSLAEAGLDGFIVERADAAVALLKDKKFSAVLLDYVLPQGNPWTVVEAAHHSIPRIPVILVTGMGIEALAAEAIHRGVEDYVAKSGDFFKLLPDIVSRSAKLAAMSEQVSHLASIIGTSDDAIMSKTLEGEILTWNPGAEKIYGYRKAEVLGRNVSLLVPDDRQEEWSAHLAAIRQGESVSQYETSCLRKDKRLIDVALTISPVRDAEGRVVGASCISRDISERKRAESLLLATLESTGDGMLVVDRQGAITRYNQKFLEMWSIPKPLAALGEDRTLLSFVVDQLKDPKAFLAKVSALYADPEAESFDTIEFKDGRYFERLSRPQRFGADCVGRVWSFHDITELKRAETTLKSKIAELEQLNEIMMYREDRIIELKEQIKALKDRP